jgi:hypothetical protein
MSSNVIVFRYSIIIEKESEIHKLRTTVFEISNEIGKMHGTVTISDGSSEAHHGRRTFTTSVMGLDSKEKELAIAKLQQVNASIQQYKRYSSIVILTLPNQSHLGLYKQLFVRHLSDSHFVTPILRYEIHFPYDRYK